jgi:signal transduction histidine kinase
MPRNDVVSHLWGVESIDVVIVDDSAVFRSALSSTLASFPSVRVVGSATTVAEAFEIVHRLRPDVVLMDVGLPDGDGLTATRRLRSEHPEIEVVVMTLHDGPRYGEQALDAGALAFVSKPRLEERLEPILAEIRERREGRTEMNLKDGRVLGRLERFERFERVEQASVLAAGLAHDLSTPLSAMEVERDALDRSLTELEKIAGGTPAGSAALARGRAALMAVDDACGYMVRMLRDFRRLTREPGTGETADVHTAVATAMRYCRALVSDRASVALSVPRDLTARIAEHTLIRVLINLILNAAQAFPSGAGRARWIDIVASAADGIVSVEVADNAGGVPAAVRSRLFEPFVTSREEGGLGLGLAIARALVRRAGGELDLVASGPLETRFRCTLPTAS